jgi:hypothetical protein
MHAIPGQTQSLTVARLIVLERGWSEGYDPFQRIGSDVFIAVSPSQNILFSSNAEASNQFLMRTNQFHKPVDLLQILNIFGPTITGTDGAENQLYRRVTSPFFNNATMHVVWEKSIESTGVLLDVLEELHTSIDEQMRPILARLTLHILNAASFEDNTTCHDKLSFSDKPLPGFELSYTTALHAVLENFATIFLTPSILLS